MNRDLMNANQSTKPRLLLWLAQGFGAGRIPLAPGTFGSVVGLLWFAFLVLLGHPVFFGLGIFLSIPVSVWICGEAEKILNQTDPASVVLDEIIALPTCFISWLAILYLQNGFWPAPNYFSARPHIWGTIGIFLLFRFFDILKPWPIRQSQKFRRGWGINLDDLIAAIYVNAAMLIIHGLWNVFVNE
ncbi:MAG: phosphatidylglycerophosphatase A family protein [Limisphaerales bacterium]